jgi:hypothetical protein
VREVVGNAAIVLDSTGPRHVAASISRLLGDPAARARLVEAGRARFGELDLGRAGERLVEALRGLRTPVTAHS